MIPYGAGSNISYATVDVSVSCDAKIVNDVAGVLAEMVSAEGAVTVPNVCAVRKIRLFAVTEVFATTTVPAASVTRPCLALAPSRVRKPLPRVVATTFPPVAVTLPAVEVTLAKEPEPEPNVKGLT